MKNKFQLQLKVCDMLYLFHNKSGRDRSYCCYAAIKQFSFECRKTEAKAITLANHNRTRENSNEPIKSKQTPAAGAKRRQARGNACTKVTIGFGLTSDWLRKWHEISQPITKSCNGKPKKLNYFRHSIENRAIMFFDFAGQGQKNISTVN